METRPEQQGAFHRFMDAQFSSLPTWLDVVPFSTEMAGDSKPGDVVFVDVYAFSIPSKSLIFFVGLCLKMGNTDNES